MRTVLIALIALIAVTTLAGCNTVSGMKQDTRQATDYTYEKKEEFQRKLAQETRELDAKMDELKAKAARASESVKAEFARDMEALDRQKAVLAQKMEAVKSSSAAGWDEVKAGANSALESIKRPYQKASARFQ